MLGRQQIAGIPTAISELFKNAHDAYADNVVVDYFRWNRLFVLRDDGIGMTREQFEKRWLTLGTESKLGSNIVQPRLATKNQRPIMGEKGIGRLAIGIIGPQVLVLTRSDEIASPIVAAFVNWSAFAVPGINLDEIEIPIHEFAELPSVDEVRALCASFATGLQKVKTHEAKEQVQRIVTQVNDFEVNVPEILRLHGGPSLAEGGSGTHFFVTPTDDQLEAALDERSARSGRGNVAAASGNLEKFLIGFSNTMTHGHPSPVIKAEFRDHKHKETFDDLIAPSTFWTPEDVDSADHWIRGDFDEYGQFRGTISVFGEQQPEHVIPWPDSKGARTACGGFSIEVAVLQGAASESKCTPEQYARLKLKLDRIAGVYVYRDNLRVLPYGNTDYDWLDIETRRTKGAGHYYFSYRNMFGAILLSKQQNSSLTEKSGREGFQENRAYRQLRDILANFFVQVAADFFRDDAEISSRFDERRKELKRLSEAQRKREAQVKVQRQQLDEELKAFFSQDPHSAAVATRESTAEKIRDLFMAAAGKPDDDLAAEAIVQAEVDARRMVDEMRDQFRIAKRRGLVLKGRLKESFERYESDFDLIDRSVIATLYEEVLTMASRVAEERHVELDQRKRLQAALVQIEAEAEAHAKEMVREVEELKATATKRISQLSESQLLHLQTVVREAQSELARTPLSQLNIDQIVEVRDGLERRMREAENQAVSVLDDLREQLSHLQLETNLEGELVTQRDLQEALEQQLASLEDKIDSDIELTQMGMAIEVINHEFENSVKAVRESLRRLKAWGDVNPKLSSIYRDLSASFQHIDGYLRMFTPMHRRLYREPVDIRGRHIFEYLRDIFLKRSEETGVVIKATRRFLDHSIRGFPSTFYPVFVNLVDNSIFWTKDASGDKSVLLDRDSESDTMIVKDTGPGVNSRDAARIFERGFTRKPLGRGLGLYIAKQALKEAGFDLTLVQGEGKGAEFHIVRSGGDHNVL